MSSPADSTLRVEVVQDLAALDVHAHAWDALVAATPPYRPTHSHAWVRTFLEHCLAAGESWQCAFGFRDDTLCAVLPLRVRGKTLSTLRDDHTPTGDAVIARDAPADALGALIDAHRASKHGTRSIRFEGIVSASPSYAWLQHAPRVDHRAAWMTGAVIDTTTPKSMDDILGALSRNSRSKIRRAERDLTAQAPLSLDVATEIDPVLAAFEGFCALEASGWKGDQGTAIRQDAMLLEFYKALLTRLASRGWARIHTLRVGDTAIAAEVLIECGPALVAHKVTFDPAYAKSSPGNLVWARTLVYACENPAIQWVDLLAMDELMQRWGATPYTYDTFVVFSRGLSALLGARLPAWLRARLRRTPSLD